MKKMTTAAADAVLVSLFVSFFAITLLANPDATFADSPSAVKSPGEFRFDDVADRLFDQAGEAQNNGDFAFAAELWDKFLKDHAKDPQALKARHYSGVCRMTLKEYGKAVQAFSAVVADEKADDLAQLEESYYYLGWCQYSLGQSKDALLKNAIETFDKHIKKFKKGKFLDQAYFLKGESLYFLGQKKDSISAYAKVVSDFPKSTSRSNAIYAMGVSQFEIREHEDAEKTFELWLSEFSDDPLADEVRLFAAESVLQQALALDSGDDKRESLIQKSRKQLSALGSLEGFEKQDEALFNLALCESQLGNNEEAAKQYAKIADQFDKSPFAKAAQLSAGKLYLRLKDYSKAEQWLKTAADSDAQNADEAMHWYCQSLLRQNKYGDAQNAANNALKNAKNPDYVVRLKLDLADAQYAQEGQKKLSVQTYVDIAEQHPKHSLAPQSLYNAAFACLELKQFSKGLELSKQFLDQFGKDPFVPDVLYVRGECFLLNQDYAEAEKSFETLTSQYTSNSNLGTWQVRYALCLYLQDKYSDVIRFLQPLASELKSKAGQAEAAFLIGASHFYQDQFDQAVKNLRQATAFGDSLKQIDEGLILLAQSLEKTGDSKEAIKSLNQLATSYPDSRYISQAGYLGGQYLSSQKEYEQAIVEYDRSLSKPASKYTPFALYGKGWALLNLQKNNEAKSVFTDLIEKHSDHDISADAFYSRAVAHRRLNEMKQAVADVDACLKAKPDFKNLAPALYEKGMALSGSKDFANAIKTFDRLVKDFPEHADADEFLYQLAWAYKSNKDDASAVVAFRQLADKYPESEIAAEALYHDAEDLYQKKQYDEAIKKYELASAKAKSKEVGEKSAYKKAWSFYQKKDYEKAKEGFEAQVNSYGTGDLTDSARFMVGESLYQADRFAEALAVFDQVSDEVLKSEQTTKIEKSLACLHAAESANRIGKYEKASEYIRVLQEDLKDQDYVAESWLELGNANRGLKQTSAAQAAFSKAYGMANNETGARAGFLVGEVLFGEKKFDDAIRQYKLVMYGYGGKRAPAAIKKWQCSSGYETARCYHVQIKDASSNEKKQMLIAEARKFYSYVIENHPADRLASESKKQLAILDKIR